MKQAPIKVLAWAGLFCGLCAAAILDPKGWRRYLELRSEVVALRQDNATAARENARLTRQARALKDRPAFLERAAREELGYIHPGELILQLEKTRGEH